VLRTIRVAVVLLGLGLLLSLPACSTTPVPSAAGSYRMTLVSANRDHRLTVPLVLSADRHFLATLTPPGSAFAGPPLRGTWSQAGDQITMTGSEGPSEVSLVAVVTRKSLDQGSFHSFARHRIKAVTLSWSAQRN
jgi:hypothetical protein